MNIIVVGNSSSAAHADFHSTKSLEQLVDGRRFSLGSALFPPIILPGNEKLEMTPEDNS